MKNQVKWAKTYKKSNWKNVVFTDEKTFPQFDNLGNQKRFGDKREKL